LRDVVLRVGLLADEVSAIAELDLNRSLWEPEAPSSLTSGFASSRLASGLQKVPGHDRLRAEFERLR